MFTECYKFNSDVSKWDVSNGENFEYMFFNCKSFNANLSNWYISQYADYEGFTEGSLLAKYPKRLPARIRGDED
jgi:surface protein